MISAETSALVAGGMRAAVSVAKLVSVRVLRAVMIGGQRIEAGVELEVERWFSAELITAGKAERVPDAPVESSADPKPAAKRAKA